MFTWLKRWWARIHPSARPAMVSPPLRCPCCHGDWKTTGTLIIRHSDEREDVQREWSCRQCGRTFMERFTRWHPDGE